MKSLNVLKSTTHLFFGWVLFLFMATCNPLHASHLMGGEITYECIAPNQYSVSLKLYRDCNGISMGSSKTINIDGQCINTTASLSLYTSSNITPLCPNTPTACGGGNGQYGVEEYLYQGTITLPSNCVEVKLSFKECCRNAAIGTIQTPGNTDLYLETTLNNATTVCNNSPQFLNRPFFFICKDYYSSYNQGFYDPDGDSLSCSLIGCKSDSGLLVNYAPGYAPNYPLSTTNGISVNPFTGMVSFEPNALQTGILALRIEEFRNGIKIGEVIRDIQITTIPCFNNPPTISGIDSTSSYDTLVSNQPFCFNIYGDDLDSNNTQMYWDNAIPSASFTVTNNGNISPHTIGTFCWTPTAADEGVHQFTVTIQDDHCPLITSQNYTYTIAVSCVHSNVEKVEKHQISIFPNPTYNRLHLQMIEGNWTDTRIRIYNIHGQLCFQEMYQQLPSSLAIDHLPAGQYILSLHPKSSKPIHLQFIKQ